MNVIWRVKKILKNECRKIESKNQIKENLINSIFLWLKFKYALEKKYAKIELHNTCKNTEKIFLEIKTQITQKSIVLLIS